MNRTWIPLLALACGMLAAAPGAYGAAVPIVNASFEDPVLAEDGWTWHDVPGWAEVGADADSGAGIWNVTLGDFDPVIAPDGENVAYTETAWDGTARGLSQVLTENFAADTDYTLVTEVGNSDWYYWSGYSVQLLAGGTVLAEDNSTLWPDYFKWATSTVAYTYDPGNAGLVGQPLEIRLLNLGLDMDKATPEFVGVEFDDVRLTAEIVHVPIPGDANDNGFVDDIDLAIVLGNWEQDPQIISTWGHGNFTEGSLGDTDVEDADLAVLLGNWTGGPPPAGAAVPEPATIALLTLGALTLARRRRK